MAAACIAKYSEQMQGCIVDVEIPASFMLQGYHPRSVPVNESPTPHDICSVTSQPFMQLAMSAFGRRFIWTR